MFSLQLQCHLNESNVIYASAQNQSVRSRYLSKSFSNKLGNALKYKLYNFHVAKVYNASDVAHYIRFFGMHKPVLQMTLRTKAGKPCVKPFY